MSKMIINYEINENSASGIRKGLTMATCNKEVQMRRALRTRIRYCNQLCSKNSFSSLNDIYGGSSR